MLSHRSIILSCYLVAFLDLFAVGMLVPLFNRRGRELGASPSLIGLIGSIYGGLQFFSSPYMGKASDTVGRKPILLISFAGCIAGYLTIGSTDTILFFALARLPTGICKHSMTSARAYLSDVTLPEERAGVMGTFNAVGSMGFIIAPIIGGYVSMQQNGFFKVSLLTCTVYVGASIFVWFAFDGKVVKNVKPESLDVQSSEQCEIIDKSSAENEIQNAAHDDLRKRKDTNSTDKVPSEKHEEKELSGISKFFNYLTIKSVRNLTDLFLIRFIMSLSMMVFRNNYTVMLDIRHGVDAKTTGYIISFGSVAGAISGMCVGKIYTIFEDDGKMLYVASLLMALSLFGITISPTIHGILVCVALLSLSTAVMRVNAHNILLKRTDANERGAVMGFGDSITSIARMMSPAIAGFAQEVSVIGPCILATTLAVVGIAVKVMLSRKKASLTDKAKKNE